MEHDERARASASEPAGGDPTVNAITAAVRAGGRRRVLAPAGMGKTRLLDQIADALGSEASARWSAAVDGDRIPDGGQVLLADDVHLADVETLQRLTRRAGGVVAAHRPARGVAASVLDALDGTPLMLGPLTHGEVRALLTDLWRTSPTPTTVDKLLTFTAGVPRLILATAGGRDGDPAVTPSLDEIVRSERRRLDPRANALLTAAAVLGDLDIAVLAAAGRLEVGDAAAATEQLAAASLTVGAGLRIVPAVAAALRQSTPSTEIAAIVELAAQATLESRRDPVAIAERACTSSEAGPMTARCLLLAAHQVLDRAPEQARPWVAAAARGNAVPADLAALRALVGFRQGRPDETIAAVDDLLRIEPQPTSKPLHLEAVEAAAVVFARRGAWTRSAALAEAVGSMGDNAVALAALARLAVGDVEGARRALRSYEECPPPGLRSEAAVTLARGLVASCDDDAAQALPLLLDAARLTEFAPARALLPETPHALAAVVACHLWEFDVAAQILTDAPVWPRGDFHRQELLSAWVAMRRGDWVGALATVNGIRTTARTLETRDAIVADAVEAGVARRRGDLETLARIWRRARNFLLRQVPDMLLLQPVGELLIAGARLEDRGTVNTCLAGVWRVVARASASLWTLSLLWDELHIAMALNDRAAAKAAAKAAGELQECGTRAGAVIRAAGCWTDALAGRADPERAHATAQGLADAGLAWEAARLAGAAAIRVSDHDQMRKLLRFARSLSAERASTLVEAATELSPRERDVAIHLLAGLTYREIGSQLFIAPKTVEHHVARIRRKVGARSRAELVLALQHHVAVDG